MPIQNVLNQIVTKQNGVTTIYKIGDLINGYYDSVTGKFYEESTHTTEIQGSPGFIYVDLAKNDLYIYKESISSYVKVSGEGGATADNIQFGYLNTEDGKFYEDDQYTIEIDADATHIYIELDTDTIYRYDSTETEYISIGGGGGGGQTYTAGTAIDIVDNIISGDYKAGTHINITDDVIKTTDFVGTQTEWDNLTSAQQATYDLIHITDDYGNAEGSPGHAIADETNEKPQRATMKFEGFNVTDDSVNGVTKIAEIPYTAGDGISITNKEIAIGDEITRTWTGTTAQWNAIVDKSVYDGWTIHITDDATTGVGPVVDVVTNGNMNAVTSNAVYNNIKTTTITITGITWTGEGHTLSSVPLNAEIISVIPNINAAIFPYRINQTWAIYDAKNWDASTTYDVTVTYRSIL